MKKDWPIEVKQKPTFFKEALSLSGLEEKKGRMWNNWAGQLPRYFEGRLTNKCQKPTYLKEELSLFN